MKRMVASFIVTDKNGKEADRFEFFADGNHGRIQNTGHCLFDGYYPEAWGEWEKTKADMKFATDFLGGKIVTIK